MLMKLFLALGGLTLVLGLLRKNEKAMLKAGLKWLIKKDHPAIREAALSHREDIEAMFEAADAAAKEALDEEAAADAASKGTSDQPKT